MPRGGAAFGAAGRRFGGALQAPIAFTRAANREIFREPVFFLMIPALTPRMISGSADRRAARAASWSPPEMASSTFRTCVRIRLRRAMLIVRRRPFLRMRFLADL